MANTFTQIYIHIVFTVQGRQNLIRKKHKEELHKYTTGIITNKGQKLIAINSMPDHIHILVGLKPDKSVSDLVRDIKANSSGFVNDRKMGQAEIPLAGGIWRFLLFPLTAYTRHHLNSGSGKTPLSKDFQARIPWDA